MEPEFNRLLVCLRGTDDDARLIESAGVIARLARAGEVIFVLAESDEAIPAALAEKYEGLTPSPEAQATELDKQVKGAFGPADGIVLRVDVSQGAPIQVFFEQATSRDVDLIVIAQPDPNVQDAESDQRLAVRLTAKAHCSLLAIPVGRELKLERVLVPVRNSECSRRALQTAIDMATRAVEAPEVISHYVYPVSSGHARVGLSYEEFSGALEVCAQEEYEALVGEVQVGSARMRAIFQDDPKDRPASLILDAIESEAADAVFIGSRGRTGAAGILLGHVTEALISGSPVPVFAIKQKGENIGVFKALGMLI